MSNQSSGQWQAGDNILDLYRVIGSLGQSEFGETYRVRHLGWNVDLAAHSPTPASIAAVGGEQELQRAVTSWINLGVHPHLASCYYLRLVNDRPLVFSEYVSGGSLHQLIQSRRLYAKGTTASLRRILDVSIQVAWGLHAAHEQGIIHQSLTPETILLTANGVVKVTEVGLARSPINYRSPEQANQDRVGRQTDLWNWGLVVLEMFAGERSWTSGLLAIQALDRYLEGGTAELPRMPNSLAQLLRRCFQEDPANRPASFKDVVQQLLAIYQTSTGSPYVRQEPAQAGSSALNVDWLNNRALALWDLGQQEEALQLWEQALTLQPKHLESLYNRDLVLWRSGGRSDQVLLNRLEANRLQSNDWQTDYLLSLVHLERGDYESALRLLGGLQAKGIQHEAIPALLERAKTRLPESRRLLPDFSERVAASQRSTAHRITSVTLSPNGRFAITGGEDQTIRVWEITTGRCLYTFRGHQGQVLAVGLSLDGSQLLSGSEDKTIKLWNVASTSHLFTFGGAENQRVGPIRRLLGNTQRTSSGNGHKGAVRAVAFSPDQRYVLSGGADAVLKLWETAAGRCVQTMREHTQAVFAVAFSPDGQQALSASDDQTIKLWDVASGQLLKTLGGHHQLTSAVFSPNGKYILAGDMPIKLWEITTGGVVQTFEDPGVQSVAFSPDQRYILSGGNEKQLKLWEINTGRCLRTFEPHESEIRGIAVSADGRYALSADTHSLKLWAVQCGMTSDLAALRLSQMSSPEATPTGDRVYEQEVAQAQTALEQGNALAAVQHLRRARSQPGYQRGIEAMQVWQSLYLRLPRQTLQSIWEQVTLERHTAAVRAVSFSPDGHSVLSGSADMTLKRWDLETERCLLSFEGHSGSVEAIALNSDGTQALSGSADQTLILWDVNTGEYLRALTGHQAAVHAVAFHPKGRFAVSGSDDRTVKLWDIQTGRCLRTLQRHQDRVIAVAISPDGRCLLSSSADKTLHVWELGTGDWLRSLEGHTAAVGAVEVSADGRYALSGSDDQTLKLWNIATGECLRTLTGHGSAVRSVRFSPDGRYAISGGDDRAIKLWNVTTGECIQTLAGHGAAVSSVAFSPDSRYVVSGSDDRTLKLWTLDWELADRAPSDWDEAASPYLDVFLVLQSLSPTALPDLREPTPEAITQALTPQGTPTWTENDFNQLIQTLQRLGYGWLRSEGVRQQLISRIRLAAQAVIRPDTQAVIRPDTTVAPTAFATEFATEFATSFADDVDDRIAKVILTITEGTLAGQEFIFTDHTVCIVGRAKDCHLLLPNDENHKTVSRYHCLLDIDPPTVRIRDLGSLHGTYINGQIIGRRSPNQTPEQGMQLNSSGHDLYSGDEIKLGKTVFKIRVETPEDSPVTQFNRFDGQTALIDRPAPAAAGFATFAQSEPALPTVAGYSVLRQLSQTGFTQSYLARHAQTDALVTLKLLQPEKTVSPAAVENFLRTVNPLKSLQHPHLAALHEVGYSDGMFLFISDAVEITLAERIQQQGRFSPQEAVAITLQLLDGLNYTHQTDSPLGLGRGMIHGHINPETLALTQVGGTRVAKIADYGIATALAQAGLGFSTNSAASMRFGFMPRQQAIDFKYAQPDVDVWAVVACLYYMITGTFPRNFDGKDPYLVVLQSEPVPIRRREATIPQALAELIDLALVDNPAMYFKNASTFKQSLASIRDNL